MLVEQFRSAELFRGSAIENAYPGESCYILFLDMKLREIDRWITRFADGFTSAQSKVDQVANLDQALGNKLDRIDKGLEKLAAFSARTEEKIQSAGTKLEALADIPARAGQKIDRLVNAPPSRKNGDA